MFSLSIRDERILVNKLIDITIEEKNRDREFSPMGKGDKSRMTTVFDNYNIPSDSTPISP
jgi:hypothetical protein